MCVCVCVCVCVFVVCVCVCVCVYICLFGFLRHISNFVGYLIPNPFLYK